jgi:hypothetical protein
VLHYHADILGKRGDETRAAEVERRKLVTGRLLARYARENPEARRVGQSLEVEARELGAPRLD